MSSTLDFVALGESSLETLWLHPRTTWAFASGSLPGCQPAARLNLEDAWHVLIFLLTDPAFADRYAREDSPDIALFLEGEAMPEADCDCCTCLYPEDVRFAVRALGTLAPGGLRVRFDSPAFQEAEQEHLYHFEFWRQAENFAALEGYFQALKAFFEAAGERGDGVIYYWK